MLLCPFKTQICLFLKGLQMAQSTQNTVTYFEVFSTLPWRKNKPLELLMCKNGLCMKILFVGHGQISLKQ